MNTHAVRRVAWNQAHRIIRLRFSSIDLFEDIADPADWDAILSAEAKTDPRVAESVGMLDLVPAERRVSGEGASWVMAPFVNASPDSPSRFSDGSFGVYFAGDRIEVALFETIHHHALFMTATDEPAGWTSDFCELVGSVDAELHDVTDTSAHAAIYHPENYAASQALALDLWARNSNGLVYQSVRYPDGTAVALFWPDVPGVPRPGQYFSYYWDGSRVSRVRNLTSREVFSVLE